MSSFGPCAHHGRLCAVSFNRAARSRSRRAVVGGSHRKHRHLPGVRPNKSPATDSHNSSPSHSGQRSGGLINFRLATSARMILFGRTSQATRSQSSHQIRPCLPSTSRVDPHQQHVGSESSGGASDRRIAINSPLWAFSRRVRSGVTTDRGEYRSLSPSASMRIPSRARSVITWAALTVPPNRRQIARDGD